MTALSNIISVNISRNTSTVARASFGTPAIIAQFTTAKTTQVFDRYRLYGSLAELVADGWLVTDSVYLAAEKLLGQAKKVTKFMVGRIDSGDANLTASLNAIQLAYADWYAFTVVGNVVGTFTLSTALITGNVVNATVAGKVVASQTFVTDHAATMTALAAKVVTALTQTGLATPTAVPTGNAMTITQAGRDINSIVLSITLGASQPTYTNAYSIVQAPMLLAASWASTQVKGFVWSDTDANILNSGATSDLAYQFKALQYDRAWGFYHANPAEYLHCAAMGLELAKDPGKSTWAHKSVQGVTPDNITEGQLTAASDKNCNTYTPISGSGRILWGKAASGENIFVIRNLDYMQSEIQADGADFKFSRDIVPADNSGITAEENVLTGTGKRMEREGVIRVGTFKATSVPYEQWSESDKTNGVNRMSFTAGIQGAILKSIITGEVSY